MSLVWHIVRKDFRRLAAPLALWLALVLAHVWLLFVWEGQMGTNAAALEGKRYFVNTCGAVVLGVGFILAAWLVMEDSLVASTAFWRTRAISGARLLAAKALGALLMFSVLPTVVLTPVWLWCGFSLRELGQAAFELGLAQAGGTVAAFALAGITATSGQFLLRLLGAAIMLPVYLAYLLGAFSKDGGPDETRSLLLAGVALLMPLAMTVHQFLTRRTARTWMIFVAGLGLMLAAGRWWPWNLTAWVNPLPTGVSAEASGLVITGQRLVADPLQSLHWRALLQLEGGVQGAAAGTHVRVDRVQAWWTGAGEPRPGPRLQGLLANGQPPEDTVRRLAGLSVTPAEGGTAWTATGRTAEGFMRQAEREHLKLRGVVHATVLQGTVLGELPLVAGAELRSGSSFTRINSIKWVDDKLVVLIEERDAWLTADSGAYSNSYDPAKRRIRPVTDSFVVLHRAQAFGQLPGVEEIGTIKADSIVVGRRNLVCAPPAGAGEDWLAGAVLVKVRFAPAMTITRPLAGEPLAPSR